MSNNLVYPESLNAGSRFIFVNDYYKNRYGGKPLLFRECFSEQDCFSFLDLKGRVEIEDARQQVMKVTE